jgi:hypothetical protein
MVSLAAQMAPVAPVAGADGIPGNLLLSRGDAKKPSIGLEPMTPSLPWAHWPGSLIRLMTLVSQDALHIVMNQPISGNRR